VVAVTPCGHYFGLHYRDAARRSAPNSFCLRGLFLSPLSPRVLCVLFCFLLFLLPPGERSYPADAVNSFRRFVRRRRGTGGIRLRIVRGINLFADQAVDRLDFIDHRRGMNSSRSRDIASYPRLLETFREQRGVDEKLAFPIAIAQVASFGFLLVHFGATWSRNWILGN